MSDVVFARPRHEYGSYADIYELVRLSGYPLVYYDEVDAERDNTTYILLVLNGELDGGWPEAKARLILYDLEWHLDGVRPIPGVSAVLAADKWYAERIGARYVPLGSHAGLNLHPERETVEKRYDAAMLAYMGPPRRQQIAHDLYQRGLRLAPNGWGEARDATLRATTLMAHVHQHEGVHTVAPGRFALAATYAMPIFTETLADPGIFTPEYLFQSDYAHYAELVAMWVHDRSRLADFGRALHWLLCEKHTFRACIEAAL